MVILDPRSIPLLNTILLFASGASDLIVKGGVLWHLPVVLASIFTALQGYYFFVCLLVPTESWSFHDKQTFWFRSSSM